MKKIYIISLTVFIFTLFSCTNSIKETEVENESKITVSGVVTFSDTADNARTATSSFSGVTMSWVLTAYAYDNSENVDKSKIYKPLDYENGSTFKFVFPDTGKYMIEARGMLENGVCAYGSETVDITNNKSETIKIKTAPQASAVLGKVRLAVNLSSDVTPFVKKVSVNWIGLEDRAMSVMIAMGYEREGNSELSPEVQANIEKLNEWQSKCSAGDFNKDFSVNNNKAIISLDGIFCGAHAVEISLVGEEDLVIYKCKEMINVYSGFTTDSWYGSSKYINNGVFTINKRDIKAYNVFEIPNYSPVTYSKEDSGYNIYRDGQTLAISNDTNQFAFDSKGNVFYVKSSGTNYLTIGTDKAGFEDKQFNVSKEEMCNQYGIMIDQETNDLYTYNFNDSSSDQTIKLYKYEEFSSFTEEWPSANDSIEIDCSTYLNGLNQWGNFKIRSVTVYDGIVYIYATGESGEDELHTLAKYDGSNLTKIFYSESSIFEGTALYGNFSDMIYQEGYIYVLYNEKLIDPRNFEERGSASLICQGGVARIKVDDGTIVRCGWAYDSNNLAKFDLSENSTDKFEIGQNWWENTNSHISYIYEDETKNKKLILDKRFYKAEYFEEWGDLLSLTQTQIVSFKKTDKNFCGPQRIIAIKPKKLVIADNGIAFYTSSDGIWAYKNVNRIVTLNLDLDNFIIESVQDSDKYFSEKMDEMLLLDGSGYSALKEDVIDGYYREPGTWEWTMGKIPYRTGYLCIPNIE